MTSCRCPLIFNLVDFNTTKHIATISPILRIPHVPDLFWTLPRTENTMYGSRGRKISFRDLGAGNWCLGVRDGCWIVENNNSPDYFRESPDYLGPDSPDYLRDSPDYLWKSWFQTPGRASLDSSRISVLSCGILIEALIHGWVKKLILGPPFQRTFEVCPNFAGWLGIRPATCLILVMNIIKQQLSYISRTRVPEPYFPVLVSFKTIRGGGI